MRWLRRLKHVRARTKTARDYETVTRFQLKREATLPAPFEERGIHPQPTYLSRSWDLRGSVEIIGRAEENASSDRGTRMTFLVPMAVGRPADADRVSGQI